MKLYLLRHGQTDWNIDWRLQGASDIPLNETGLNQAREAAQKYAALPFTVVYSSPLVRAMTTASIIAAPHGLAVKADDRLKEMCFGDLEGTTPDESALSPELQAARDKLFHAPHRYEPVGNGETFHGLIARVADFLEDVKNRHTEDDAVLVSAHGAVCKAFVCVCQKVPVEKFWETPPQPNCSIVEVEW